ncbi:cytochrome P450 [Streptosporangium sp. DT93]|uniref:cytochrome P450 n=1 Tax=Streptosporangium sp. DT93 TaxID=3393428 RepID=UPI003CEDFB74
MSTDDLIQEAEAAVVALSTPPQPPDPYPHYAALRRANPVYYSEPLQAYAVTGYAEVAAAAKMPNMGNGPRAAAMRRQGWEDHESLRLFMRALVTLDPPDHTHLRGLASKVFTPAAIRRVQPSIERMVGQRLDELAERASGGEPVDLVELVASPFPVQVICELLGVPAEQGMLFYDLANDWTRVWGGGNYSDEELAKADESTVELRNYFDALFADRRRKPGEDLLSGLVKVGDESRLPPDDLMALATFLFVAGFETTTNLISCGVWTLTENPDQLDLWRERPDITPGAIEELIRHGTPISGTARVSTGPVRLGDKEIPAGQLIFLMTAGANRDPRQFPDPDKLILTRDDGPHAGFGGGPHYCLGAALARMETQVLFPALINRFSVIEVAGEPQWRTATGLHGFEKLELVLK